MADKFEGVDFSIEKSKGSEEVSQRQEMLDTLRSGRSTMHKGRHITKISQVPSEAELAKGNPILEARAKEFLEQQRADVEAQLNKLNAPKAETKAESKAKVKEDSKEEAPAKK